MFFVSENISCSVVCIVASCVSARGNVPLMTYSLAPPSGQIMRFNLHN